MKYTQLIFLVIVLLPARGADIIKYAELENKNGRYYMRKSGELFSGYVTGNPTGKMQKGQREGLWTERYNNGQVFWEGTYKEGEMHGLWLEYHSNGNLFARGNYVDGIKDRVWQYFGKSTKLIAEEEYRDGRLIRTDIIPSSGPR